MTPGKIDSWWSRFVVEQLRSNKGQISVILPPWRALFLFDHSLLHDCSTTNPFHSTPLFYVPVLTSLSFSFSWLRAFSTNCKCHFNWWNILYFCGGWSKIFLPLWHHTGGKCHYCVLRWWNMVGPTNVHTTKWVHELKHTPLLHHANQVDIYVLSGMHKGGPLTHSLMVHLVLL